MAIAGFNAIDGVNDDDLVAVGYYGEIWRAQSGSWRALKSPARYIRSDLRVIDEKEAYACGQSGMLLAGQGDAWKPIATDQIKEDLWGLEWFRDHVYVASQRTLYRLEGDHLMKIDMGLGPGRSCGHLSATSEVLWSFGEKHLAWTRDAVHWVDATPFG